MQRPLTLAGVKRNDIRLSVVAGPLASVDVVYAGGGAADGLRKLRMRHLADIDKSDVVILLIIGAQDRLVAENKIDGAHKEIG